MCVYFFKPISDRDWIRSRAIEFPIASILISTHKAFTHFFFNAENCFNSADADDLDDDDDDRQSMYLGLLSQINFFDFEGTAGRDLSKDQMKVALR